MTSPTTNPPEELTSDILENVRDRLKINVKTGCYTKAELLENAIHYFSYEEIPSDHPNIQSESERIIDSLWAKQLRRQEKWSEAKLESYLMVQRAFRNLNQKGIVARENFYYTQQQADFNIRKEATGNEQGFAYWHGQDTEKALDGFGLVIRFGVFNFDDEASTRVGEIVHEELKAVGLPAQWNGTAMQAIYTWYNAKYISGFGGDADNVNIIGQSAGAASVNFQMHSEEPLFKQAILLGGSFLMMRPATEETAERLYKNICDDLGLADKTTEDRVKNLETMPVESMLSSLTPGLASLGPVVDGVTVPTAATFATLGDAAGFSLPGYKWCRRILVIDSQADGSLFGLVNLQARRDTIISDFTAEAQKTLGEAGKHVLDAYNISPGTPPSIAVERAVQFVTDVAFYAPAIKIAEAWSGKSYVCHFNEGNPFPGLYEGRASHQLDTAYLWGLGARTCVARSPCS
ncbi:Alpha/Beta hydrolase protein [Aspergillus germanicus]